MSRGVFWEFYAIITAWARLYLTRATQCFCHHTRALFPFICFSLWTVKRNKAHLFLLTSNHTTVLLDRCPISRPEGARCRRDHPISVQRELCSPSRQSWLVGCAEAEAECESSQSKEVRLSHCHKIFSSIAATLRGPLTKHSGWRADYFCFRRNLKKLHCIYFYQP